MDNVTIVFEKIKYQFHQEIVENVSDLYGYLFEKDITSDIQNYSSSVLQDMLDDLQKKEPIVDNIKDMIEEYDDILLDLEKMNINELKMLHHKIQNELE